MRDLLDKAHQQDEEELFAEVEDDEEFAAPRTDPHLNVLVEIADSSRGDTGCVS